MTPELPTLLAAIGVCLAGWTFIVYVARGEKK